ncbi:CMP-sialic acid transporter 4-like isoform X3 [Abrus precatorius]|uniref:CMP-sialic acid transporter 4-like isoform X3 n=1 Tax=Abrus precatorius TaxID=3816 RepID=A0A8B8JH28_ABRPR|nr:CMP-sialic acid transporter 4-like isoform X3 [Abrus precatorius]
MEYRKIKDEDEDRDAGVEDVEKSFSLSGAVPDNNLSSVGETKVDSLRTRAKWKRKSAVTLALTILTSSQAILIVWSKRAGKYEYSVTTANFLVETLKCAISLVALGRIWNKEGVTEDNRLSEIQWAAFVLLTAGCTTAQLNSNSDRVLQAPFQGWVMAIVMALLSGFAGVYTEAIIKKRPSRNINVQNFWLYVFGMCFNAIAMLVQDFDAVMNKGFFHGYSFITILMIFNHALSGIAVSMVMKYADNIVKVYSTSVAMLLTAVVSVFLFGFHLSLAFFLGTVVVSVAIYLHSAGKIQR